MVATAVRPLNKFFLLIVVAAAVASLFAACDAPSSAEGRIGVTRSPDGVVQIVFYSCDLRPARQVSLSQLDASGNIDGLTWQIDRQSGAATKTSATQSFSIGATPPGYVSTKEPAAPPLPSYLHAVVEGDNGRNSVLSFHEDQARSGSLFVAEDSTLFGSNRVDLGQFEAVNASKC